MGYSFKTKSTKSKQSNIFKIRTCFLNLKLQIIRLAQNTGILRRLTKTAIFIAAFMEKTYLAVHFTKECFCQFVDRKVVGVVPKNCLLARVTRQVSIFPYMTQK